MGYRLATIWIALAIIHDQALACRYTVRDIGFAALRSHEYALVLSWQPTSDVHQTSECARAADAWAQALKTQLHGSNVTVMIDPQRSSATSTGPSDEDEPTITATEANGAFKPTIRIELVDRQARALTLTDSLEHPIDTTSVPAWLDEHLFVPVLDQISNEALESFAHLLIVEGDDGKANQAVHSIADQAMAAIQRLEPLLPRPIAFPLRKIVVDASQLDDQRLLRQLIGNADDSATLLTVLYGRGRLAGPVMSGQSTSLKELLAQLALVGQSCECETDRAWMDESSLPFRWEAAMRGRASSLLGFDPDSPLVRAEMLRIVAQGAPSIDKKKAASAVDSPDTIAQMLLGYSETPLTASGEARNPIESAIDANRQTNSTAANTENNLGKPAGVRSTIIAGDGWDFESGPVQREDEDKDRQPPARGIAPTVFPDRDSVTPVVPTESRSSEDTSRLANQSAEDSPSLSGSVSSILVLTLAAILGAALLVVLVLMVRIP